MIVIITGKIDSGKTTKLVSVYNESNSGDGFIIKKVYKQENHIGQDILRLSTWTRKPFSLMKSLVPQHWDEALCYGPYSFSAQGFSFANSIITDALQMNSEPLYIDEIGPLELQGKGFSDILTLALASRKSLYITVRETCLHAVTEKFDIHQYEVMYV